MPQKEIVGVIGHAVATYSHEYIGYISYLYLFGFLYLLYLGIIKKVADLTIKLIASFFLFFSILIFQALVFEDPLSGRIGEMIIDIIAPFIGIAGLWIFVCISLGLSFFALLQSNKEYLQDILKKFNFIKIKNYAPDMSQAFAKKEKRKKVNLPPSKKELKPLSKITVKEVGDTAEIIIEDEKEETETFEDKTKNYEPTIVVKEIDESEATQIDKEQKNSIIVDELEENKKLLDDIEQGKIDKPKDFKLPSFDFFQKPPKQKTKINESVIDKKIEDLLEKLLQFKIDGDVVRTYSGPIVTTFEFKPAPNVKVSKILNLQDDLAMALKAQTIRIQAPIPGKDVVGIEVPNEETDTIYLREILESDIFQNAKSPLTMILGKDIVGKPFITDLKKLPHLLIAGTTGSGKSVGINSMILSLLYRNSPDNLKLIMIDPKMLEFSIYNDIPHLLTPVITRPTEAINALANMVKEMEKRYAMMADTRTKNIENYNEKAKELGYEQFPYIVVIIDELADLMMTSGKEVEMSIARLAQMARASGIHLIVATQRPSVDVVTGLIKANLPSRISYKVGQKVDSKIILDSLGAESLLGRGDLLFTPPGMSGLVRIHAPWSDEKEIDKVVEFLKIQREVEYDTSFLKDKVDEFNATDIGDVGELDDLYEQAKLIVVQDQKSSISYLQRRLKIGYNRAASIVEQLEQTGILSEANSKGNREILI